MKKIFYFPSLLALFVSTFALAQEQLDEDFLKSLPEEIRNDFIREMGENNEVKDEIYNAPRTSIDTLESNLQKIREDIKIIRSQQIIGKRINNILVKC